MMSFIMFLLFMIPFVFFCYWWVFLLLLVLVIFTFMSYVQFEDFFCKLSYSLGGDLLSMCMILLSFWIVCLMIFASFSVYLNNQMFGFFMLMILILLIFLFFCFSTTNLFLFYLFFEGSLIPMLILIFGWGYQPERLGAGFYLLFYTFIVSLPLLLSIFYVDYYCFTLYYFLIFLDCNFYLYICMISAFLVSMPMIFLHFWLPKAHVEAPIAGSMILAGVFLKMGGYGLMRVFMFIYEFSFFYNYLFICLSFFGMIMVGVLCLYQVDMKSLVAYSSVAHMGAVLCGILSFNNWGLMGALVLMIGHGLCSSGLFCLVNILYERNGSRSFFVNKGLINYMPIMSLFWFILMVNNIASPLSLGLLGEIMLINSLVGWSVYGMLFLGLLSFFSCCYNIYFYSYIHHGYKFSGFYLLSEGIFREYLLLFMHIFPLNVLILSADIVVLWI